MERQKLEYIWLDGNTPEPSLRSKTKVISCPLVSLGDVPEWSFDGSSTKQAPGNSSDCVLKPVKMVKDAGRRNANLVLCEVYTAEGEPHLSNFRAKFDDDDEAWFGFEQEYTLIDPETNRPIGFPKTGYPDPQGKYYCAVGHRRVVARDIVEEHLNLCLDAGLEITGINAEVMLGQWEYQVFAKGAKAAADACWLARYFLFRVAEKHGVDVSFHPKPEQGDWNGSGMHTNFSTKEIREEGGKDLIENICKKFGELHIEHINEYGSDNDQRLTGLHETAPITRFSYGVSDRGASIRIPLATVQNEWKGYLEDRRPASNADPYRIVARILKTLKS